MTQEKATASEEAQALLTKVAPNGYITSGADAYLFDMRGPALLDALLSEVAQLRNWKESAMHLLRDYDAIAESFGGALGISKVQNLERGVAQLREAAEAATVALELLTQWVGPPPTGPYDFDSLREDGWKTAKAALAHLRALLAKER